MISARFVLLVVASALVIAAAPIHAMTALWIVESALVVLFTTDIALAQRPSDVEFRRSVPPVLEVGSDGTVTWQVINRSRRKLTLKFADELAPSLGSASRRFTVRVDRKAATTITADLSPRRRGSFVIEKLAVRTFGPLGLAGLQGTHWQRSKIKVYPRFASRREAEIRIARARISEVGLRAVRQRGSGTDFDQLREYTPDDDFRRIDWAATVRVMKPIVRTFRAERNQNVVCMMDCGRVMAGQIQSIPRLEHAMDAVMAVTAVATRLGDRAGLVAFDDSVRKTVSMGSGNKHLAAVTDAMFELEPRLVESDYRRAAVEFSKTFRRRSMVVIFSELNSHLVDETLVPAIGLLSRNHLVVVASVIDPQLLDWARSLPLREAAAFQKAAAIAALEERRRIVARLRGLGVIVVDSEAGKLGADVADVYLDVKASGRL